MASRFGGVGSFFCFDQRTVFYGECVFLKCTVMCVFVCMSLLVVVFFS